MVWRRKDAGFGLSHDSLRVAPLLEPWIAESYRGIILNFGRKKERCGRIGVARGRLASAGVEVSGVVKVIFRERLDASDGAARL